MKSSITPAILQPSFAKIASSVRSVEDIAMFVQIDIVDGIYADTATWPFTGVVTKEEIQQLNNIRTPFELDLLINKPEETIDIWLSSIAVRFIIHLAATNNIQHCISLIKEAQREIYIGIAIDDDFTKLDAIANRIDGVQCMGIVEIGKQGGVYDQRVESVVEKIKKRYPALPIQVDGGIKKSHIPHLLQAGASKFAVGSAIFVGDIDTNFSQLSSATRYP